MKLRNTGLNNKHSVGTKPSAKAELPLDFDGHLISGGLDEFLALFVAHLEHARPVDVDDEVAIPQPRVVSYRVEGDLNKDVINYHDENVYDIVFVDSFK